MASEAISTAILVIAGVVVATSIVAAIYSQVSLMNSTIRITSKVAEDRIKTEVKITHLAVNNSGNYRYIVLFVKNIGVKDITQTELMKSDIYIGSNSCNIMCSYSSEPIMNGWNYVILDRNGDKLWNPGETAIISIFNSTAINSPICAKIVLPNGVSHEAAFYT